MKFRFAYTLPALLALILLVSCSKELSLEDGGPVSPTNTSEGTLSGAPGACANITVLGAYGQGTPLDSAYNKLVVQINFSKEGTWFIYTDTVDGFSFSGSGVAAATGIAQVELKATGTPLNPGQFNYKVNYKGAVCTATVEVFQTAVATSGDYYPTTPNSWWTYLSNNPAAAPGDTAFILSTGITGTLPNGTVYNLFTRQVPGFKDSSFYRKLSGSYFEFGDLDITGAADLPVVGEWTFLKDNVAVATEWFSPELVAKVAGVDVKMRIRFVLAEKDVSVLLGNKVYAKTIKVRATQQAQLTGAVWTDLLTYETWFAKGIGLVNLAAPAPFYGYRVVKYSVN